MAALRLRTPAPPMLARAVGQGTLLLACSCLVLASGCIPEKLQQLPPKDTVADSGDGQDRVVDGAGRMDGAQDLSTEGVVDAPDIGTDVDVEKPPPDAVPETLARVSYLRVSKHGACT